MSYNVSCFTDFAHSSAKHSGFARVNEHQQAEFASN